MLPTSTRLVPRRAVLLGLLVAACFARGVQAMQTRAPSVAPPASSDRFRQADEAFRAGYAAASNNDLTTARAEFQKVVALVPGMEEGHSALGAVLVQMGQYARAIPELRRSLRMKPADRNAAMNLALAYAQTGANAKAIPLFQRLEGGAQSGGKPAALPADVAMAYGRALASEGKINGAIAVLERAIDAQSNVAALHDSLGTLYAQQQRWAEAKDEFRQAIVLAPKDATAHLHLGTAQLATGQQRKALSELKLAAQLAPASPQAQLQLGQAMLDSGDDGGAVPVLQRAADLAPASMEAKYQLAIALQGTGKEKLAIPLFRAVVAAQPANTAAIVNLALALVQTGDAKDAIDLYRRAMQQDPKNITIYQDIGVAYLQQSDIEDAIASFKTGLQLSPQDAQLHYDLGLAYKLKDNVTAALAELEQSSKLDPTLPDPHYTLGILYMQEGRFTDSEQQLQTALRMQPNNADGWSILGSVYRQQNKLPQAVAALQESLRQQPDQPSGYITLASILAQQGNREEAALDRKKAADLMKGAANHQRATFAINSGNLLMQKGDLKQAIERYQEAIRSDPTDAEAYRALAVALDQEGKFADAKAAREQARHFQKPSP